MKDQSERLIQHKKTSSQNIPLYLPIGSAIAINPKDGEESPKYSYQGLWANDVRGSLQNAGR